MRYTDDELLKMVGEERKRSIGFGEGESGELESARERALLYYKGDVTKDIPTLLNRSAATSTDIAEAVETALPDLLEVLIGGDDVATFTPQNADDEDRAREESEFVKHVIFNENDGFLTFYSAIKDALLVKTGIFHWWWHEEEKSEELGVVPAEEADMVEAVMEIAGKTLEREDQDGGASFSQTKRHGKICIKAVSPEDFTVGRDTVSLKDATYCAMRDRPRVQALIARGVDAEVARSLKSYTQPSQTVANARDEAGEESLNADDATGDLRQVEVRAHYVRLLGEKDKLEVWRIVTDSEEKVLIEKEEVGSVPFGAITPYINAHRFYGESLADKLFEVQKIKTTLWRMHLDDGYFALNQRMQVDMNYASEFTISDLLRNEPNMPVRTKGPAVTALRAGGLNFDPLAALEYASTVGEARTGVVRNAQGLNPDTLHDTAKGAMALINAAQKRIRLIARVIAETGVKDLYLGVHALMRRGYGAEGERVAPTAKLSGQWKEVQPGKWSERAAVDVQVGIGSAGREQELIILTELMQVQERMAMAGLGGVIIKPENLYNAAKRFAQAGNLKTPDLYFSDPKDAEPQPPKPDPEMMKVQGQLQLEQGKAQATLQLEHQKSQAKLQSDATNAQMQSELELQKMDREFELKRYQIDAELGLKREQLVAEIALKRELGMLQAQVAHETGMAKVSASTSSVEVGGDPG